MTKMDKVFWGCCIVLTLILAVLINNPVPINGTGGTFIVLTIIAVGSSFFVYDMIQDHKPETPEEIVEDTDRSYVEHFAAVAEIFFEKEDISYQLLHTSKLRILLKQYYGQIKKRYHEQTINEYCINDDKATIQKVVKKIQKRLRELKAYEGYPPSYTM